MKTTACKGAVVIALALITPASAAAQALPGWAKDAIKSAEPTAPKEARAVILLDDTRLKLDANLEASIRRRRVAQILHSDGMGAAVFQTVISGSGKLEGFNAWTLRPDKQLSFVGKRKVVESSYRPGGYSDLRRYLLAAPKARVGDYVAFESKYETELTFPSFRWFPQLEGWPVATASIDVELPEGWEFEAHVTQANLSEPITKTDWGRFEASNLPMVPEEPDRPEIIRVAPRVLLRFLDPVGTQTYSRWEEVATWYQGVCAPQLSGASGLKDLTDRASGLTPEYALRLFSAEAQHSINYVAIELGEQSWVPDTATDTWRRRYGDCKDKSTVLVAALATRGIEARPVLVCTSDQGAVDPDAPIPTQFNHCIVAFEWNGDPGLAQVVTEGPSGKKWAFFDPTASHVPLGFLPRTVADTWAVIADSSEGLVKLPPKSTLTLRQESTLRLERDGRVVGEVRITGEGIGGGVISYLNDQHLGRPEEWLERVLGESWVGAEVSQPEVSKTDSAGFNTSMSFRIESRELAKPWSTSWMVRPLLIGARMESAPRDSSRALPIWLGGPTRFEDHVTILLPEGFAAGEQVTHEWQGGVGKYSLRHESEPGKIVLVRSYEIGEEMVPAGRYPEVRALWDAAYRGDGAAILIAPE